MLRTRLNNLGREVINNLIKENVVLSPDEIVIIHELSKRATQGLLDSRLLVMASKKIGNVEIYPLTMGAKIWMRTVLIDFFPDDEIMAGLVVLYAYSNARSPEKLNFTDAEKCKNQIMEWVKTYNITDQEFEEVVNSFNHYIPKDEIWDILNDLVAQIRKNPNNIDLNKFYNIYKMIKFNEETTEDLIPALSILMKYYGGTKEHWMWNESEDVCMAFIKQAIEMETGKKQEQLDPSFVAYRELMKYIKELKEASKKCQKN